MNIYIDYSPRDNGYYYGILGEDGYIKWNNSIFAMLDKIKEEVYEKYPDAVILVRD